MFKTQARSAILTAAMSGAIALFVGCGPLKTQPELPKPTHRVVAEDCIECDGKGKVVYSDDHPIVKSGAGKPGEFSCPMCGGSGTLYADVTE